MLQNNSPARSAMLARRTVGSSGQPAAMQGSAINQMRPQQPAAPQGPYTAVAPQAAQVDTSRTDAIAQQQNELMKQNQQFAQDASLNAFSGLQRRNASNAARAGLQAGGASYLSGQRSAAIQGNNAMRDVMSTFNNQAMNTLQGQAGILSGAQTANAGNQQSAWNVGAANQQSTNNQNTQYGIENDRASQEAQTTYYGNQMTEFIDQADRTKSINTKSRQASKPEYQAATDAYWNYKDSYDKAIRAGNFNAAEQILAQMRQLVSSTV